MCCLNCAAIDNKPVLFFLDLDVYTILHRKNIVMSLKAVEFLEDILCEDDRILVNKFD